MNKNLILLTTGRVSQMFIMFFTYRVLSSVLSVPEMGIYYFLLSISAGFGLIYANPIGMYTNRMLHGWLEHGALQKNLKIVLYSFLVGSFLTIPLLFIFRDKISLEGQSLFSLIAVLVFYVFSTTLNGTVIPSLNFLGFTKHFVIWTFLTNALGLVFSYTLVRFVAPGPINWLIGQAVAFFLCGVIALLILFFKTKVQSEKQIAPTALNGRLKRVLSFAFPVVITNVAVWSLGQSFRFFYKENIDLTILGELAFGLGVATSLSVAVEYLLQQFYFPEFYRDISNPAKDSGAVWNQLLNKLIPPYIFLMMFLIGLSPFIMQVLADVKFKNAYQYLALGAVVEILRMLGNIFTMATQSEMKTHKAIVPYLSGGAVTVIGVLFICRHPEYVRMTPFCLMAGYLVSLINLRFNVGKIIKVEMNYKAFLKAFMLSLVFLTAQFFSTFSSSMTYSILIAGFYGLIFAFFMYQSYLQGKMEQEV